MDIAKIETENYTFTIVPRGPREAAIKARVHVDGVSMDDVTEPAYTPRGDDPANDQRWDAYRRVQIQRMRDAAFDAMHELMAVAGAGMDLNRALFAEQLLAAKLAFSKKAGCSMCDCSPGFITDQKLVFGGENVHQVSVDVKKGE
jgi:hypothetical protein